MTTKRSITRVCHWACSLSGKAAQIGQRQLWRLRHPVLHSVRDLDLPLDHPVVEETIIKRIGGRCAGLLSHALTQAGNEHFRTSTKGETSVSKEAPRSTGDYIDMHVHASGNMARGEWAQCILWRARKHLTDDSQSSITTIAGEVVRKTVARGSFLTLAELLCKLNTVSQEWIVQRLSIRGPANVSQQLRRFDWMTARPRLPPELGDFPYEARKVGVWLRLFLVENYSGPFCRFLQVLSI
jgi:hypothetical protein